MIVNSYWHKKKPARVSDLRISADGLVKREQETDLTVSGIKLVDELRR